MNDKGHLYTSLTKSCLRILGCVLFLLNGIAADVVVAFLLAEVLGIVEEMLDKR